MSHSKTECKNDTGVMDTTIHHFSDGDKFMVLENGQIAYKAEGTTWRDRVLHGMTLDEKMMADLHVPRICVGSSSVKRSLRCREKSTSHGMIPELVEFIRDRPFGVKLWDFHRLTSDGILVRLLPTTEIIELEKAYEEEKHAPKHFVCDHCKQPTNDQYCGRKINQLCKRTNAFVCKLCSLTAQSKLCESCHTYPAVDRCDGVDTSEIEGYDKNDSLFLCLECFETKCCMDCHRYTGSTSCKACIEDLREWSRQDYW